jgi:hypothetical protein
MPHCISAESLRLSQVTHDTTILRESIQEGEFGFYPFDQSSDEDSALINESRTSIGSLFLE